MKDLHGPATVSEEPEQQYAIDDCWIVEKAGKALKRESGDLPESAVRTAWIRFINSLLIAV